MTQDSSDLKAELIDDLQIAIHSGEVIRVGPSINLYHTRPRDADIGYLRDVVDKFVQLAGHDNTFAAANGAHLEPVPQAQLSEWCEDALGSDPIQALSLDMHGGDTKEEAHPVYFRCLLPASWNPEPISYMSLGVSMARLMASGTTLIALVQELCEAFHPDHGHSGFAVTTNGYWSYASDVIDQYAAILERFPGLDYPAVPSGVYVQRVGPVAANWITVLSDQFVSKLGGRNAVSERLDGVGGRALPWSGGMILIAPGAPQIGDSEAGHDLAGYAEVGQMIAGVRGAKEAGYFPGGKTRDMMAFSRSWRNRFDG